MIDIVHAVSQIPDKCGPGFGRCNKLLGSWAIYCNTDNGQCGETDVHRDAQPGDEYDWEPGIILCKFLNKIAARD